MMRNKTLKFGLFVLALTFVAAGVWAGGGGQNLSRTGVTIANFWENYDVNTYTPQDEHAERVLEWRRRIQRDHGILVKESLAADWGSYLENAITTIMAGRPAAQAFHMQPDWAMSMYRQSLLAPLSDNKAVDFSSNTSIPYRQVQYNREVANIFTFGGKQYAATVGYGGTRHAMGVYFNKRSFREAGLDPDTLYNMQRDGTWTWDGMVDILRRMNRDSGNTGRTDIWGMSVGAPEFMLEMLVAGNGGDFVTKDASGRMANTSNRPEVMEAINFYRRLMNENLIMPRPENPSSWEWYMQMFYDGSLGMLVSHEYQVSFLGDMTDDWGFVLPPRGPRANDYRFPTDELVIVVPSTYKGDDLDTICNAINLWYMPVDDDWKAPLWSFYRDPRAVDETLSMIRGPGKGAFSLYVLVPGFSVGDLAWPILESTGEPAQLVESVSANWNALIQEANNIR